MLTIRLICAAGMSTSLLVEKMKKSAIEKSLECDIKAYSVMDLENGIAGAEVILVGPQARFEIPTIEEKVEGKIPVEVIDTFAYGTMNGAVVLDQALKLIDMK